MTALILVYTAATFLQQVPDTVFLVQAAGDGDGDGNARFWLGLAAGFTGPAVMIAFLALSEKLRGRFLTRGEGATHTSGALAKHEREAAERTAVREEKLRRDLQERDEKLFKYLEDREAKLLVSVEKKVAEGNVSLREFVQNSTGTVSTQLVALQAGVIESLALSRACKDAVSESAIVVARMEEKIKGMETWIGELRERSSRDTD